MNVHVTDNHEIIIQGYIALLKANGINIVGTSTKGNQLINWLKTNTCDIIILDISITDINGVEMLKYLYENKIKSKVIVVSALHDVGFVKEAIRYGAKGFMVKEEVTEEIINALYRVNQGKSFFSEKIRDVIIDKSIEEGKVYEVADILSPQQIEIIKLIHEGYQTKEICQSLKITPSSLRTATSRARFKFGVKTNVGLVLMAMRHKFK